MCSVPQAATTTGARTRKRCDGRARARRRGGAPRRRRRGRARRGRARPARRRPRGRRAPPPWGRYDTSTERLAPAGQAKLQRPLPSQSSPVLRRSGRPSRCRARRRPRRSGRSTRSASRPAPRARRGGARRPRRRARGRARRARRGPSSRDPAVVHLAGDAEADAAGEHADEPPTARPMGERDDGRLPEPERRDHARLAEEAAHRLAGLQSLVVRGAVVGALLEHDDAAPRLGEERRHHRAARARADDDHVAVLVEAARQVAAVGDGIGRGDLAAHARAPAESSSAEQRGARDGAGDRSPSRSSSCALLEGGDAEGDLERDEQHGEADRRGSTPAPPGRRRGAPGGGGSSGWGSGGQRVAATPWPGRAARSRDADPRCSARASRPSTPPRARTPQDLRERARRGSRAPPSRRGVWGGSRAPPSRRGVWGGSRAPPS